MQGAQTDRGLPNWWQVLLLVMVPALAAAAGYAAAFRMRLPPATEVLLMLWALAMTFLACQAMAHTVRSALGVARDRAPPQDE